MTPFTPDVRNLTQKELSAAVKAHENADGTASQFTLAGSDIHVTINACYVGGSGQHRAWKYRYYLTINGRKFGGYDRRDSFVAWAIGQIKEVAPQQGVAGVSGVHPEGQLPTPSASVPVSAFKPDVTAHGLMLSADINAAPSADSQTLEVASPETSTAQTDTTGMAAKASVDVPEKIEVADQGKANPRIGSLRVGNEGGEILADSPLCHLESLADFSDEGETGWNAQRRNDIAKKMQRIAAGGYNSVDKLIGKVEELAEVGQ